MIEQLDLEKLVRLCVASTRCDEALVRDALLDILCAMWDRRDRYQSAFDDKDALAAYIRVSTVRHLIRVHKRDQRITNVDPNDLRERDQMTPEEKVISLLSQAHGQKWLNTACQSMNAREAREVRKLIKLVLRTPETYIQTRKSGENEGQYVFRYQDLARALGWSRKQVYNRLSVLRNALHHQRHRQSGESR